MSVPSGIASDTGLPVGLQIMGPALGEERIYRVGAAFESAYAAAQSGLVPDFAPELEVMTS
jgi:aspartyl-tRNA(Asn)/glutamyl-tRNA(Gln) amidotransferase subunit A